MGGLLTIVAAAVLNPTASRFAAEAIKRGPLADRAVH
jgi:hypothetical protein